LDAEIFMQNYKVKTSIKAVSLMLLILFILLILCAVLFPGLYSSRSIGLTAISASETVDRIKCKFFNNKDFLAQANHAHTSDLIDMQVWPAASNSSKSLSMPAVSPLDGGTIIGGIVPHHLLAGAMISDFFKTIGAGKPDVVVVFAPNHKRTGFSLINTSSLDWETPFGILGADSSCQSILINALKAGESRNIMEDEYSISGLVPYIKYYMTDAKILPILLHGDYGQEKSQKLGAQLASSLRGKKCIFLASVDFSHYLPVHKADNMDEITLAAIKENRISSIANMGNDNLDSPPSIMALLSAMNASGADGMKLIDHSNSSRIASGGENYTTSYFSIVFCK